MDAIQVSLVSWRLSRAKLYFALLTSRIHSLQYRAPMLTLKVGLNMASRSERRSYATEAILNEEKIKMRKIQGFSFVTIVAGVLLLGACNKKVAKSVPPSPPPPPAAPTATLAANPNVINQGQAAELNWKTSNADTISIEGLGIVPPSGSRFVTPSSSTTYTLVAKGAGGTEEASTRVSVNPPVAKNSPSDEEFFRANVRDVFFDYDKSELRSDQGLTAQTDAAFLAQHPDIKIVIEGHCDDRGSEQYNLALGDSRASSLKNSLLAQGVSADRIKTISYGKERPFCSQDDEQCWKQNRRDHLNLQQ